MNTLLIFGFLAVILMLSSCEGSKLFLDGDDVNFEVDVSVFRKKKKDIRPKDTIDRVDPSRHIVIYMHN